MSQYAILPDVVVKHGPAPFDATPQSNLTCVVAVPAAGAAVEIVTPVGLLAPVGVNAEAPALVVG